MAPAPDRPPGPVPGTAAPGSQTQQRAQQRQYASKTSRSQAATPASEMADMRLEFQQQTGSRTISAPTSPAKTRDSILQRVQSLTDAAKEKASSIGNDIKYAAATRRQQRVNKDRVLTLLVVDDENFDW